MNARKEKIKANVHAFGGLIHGFCDHYADLEFKKMVDAARFVEYCEFEDVAFLRPGYDDKPDDTVDTFNRPVVIVIPLV